MSSTINALTSGGGLAMAGDTSGQLALQSAGTTYATGNQYGIGLGTAVPSSGIGIVDVVGLTITVLSVMGLLSVSVRFGEVDQINVVAPPDELAVSKRFPAHIVVSCPAFAERISTSTR